MKYDLVIKGGTVIDPLQGMHGLRDVAIARGTIAALAVSLSSNDADRVIDATGMFVTPGLIDIHAHVADGIFPGSVPPDTAGVLSGVTTICDAGSVGYATFPGFKRFVVPSAQTDILCFLNLSSAGFLVLPEIWSWQNINRERVLATVHDNRDMIKGLKLRAVGGVVDGLGIEAIRLAKRLAFEARLPLMIHIGLQPEEPVPDDVLNAFTREMLSLLGRDDILSHVFTWKRGGVIRPDGSVLAEFREAVQRGLALDVAEAWSNWSYRIALTALGQGILPSTISTDLSDKGLDGPVFSLPVAMSKFLAMGLTLEQVIAMTTATPARLLGEERRRGSLRPGMPADISVLELAEGDFVFSDGVAGNKFTGRYLIKPRITIKSGKPIETQLRFEQQREPV